MEIEYKFSRFHEVDPDFFDDDVLMEKSRIDGISRQKMLECLLDPDNIFLVAAINGETIAVTSVELLKEDSCEIHGYILPKYKILAVEVLEKQLRMLLHLGFKNIYTVCCCRNNNVKNFFVKRMGFTVYYESDESGLTVDGKKVKLIKLMRSFN